MFHISPQPHILDGSDQTRSPLGPRTSNACPRFSALMASEVKPPFQKPGPRQQSVQKAPLQRNSGQQKDQRRQAFLQKVRQASEDKRWEHRSDQILRQDFLARQKYWEEQQETSAPEASPSLEEEPENRMESTEADIVDQILSQEYQELEALVSSMQETSHAAEDPAGEDHEQAMTDYGSDEEQYDRLFMDMSSQQQETGGSPSRMADDMAMHDQEMDISME